MSYSKFSPALLLVAAAIGACSKGSSTNTSPAPSASPAASAAAARPATPAPRPFTTAMVTLGDSLFHARSCRNCHGADAKGAANGNGPNLITDKFLHVNGSYQDFVRIITMGVPADSIKVKTRTLAMQPRGGGRPAPLTDDQINAIAAYVYSLNHP